jgi:polyhydroxyalkanoate synthesis regulator protein
MWAPLAPLGPMGSAVTKRAEPEAPSEDSLNDMKRQLEAIQKQLDQLSGGKKP